MSLRLVLFEGDILADTPDATTDERVKGIWHVEDNTELFKWWVATSMGDWQASVPKTDEYGAHDLEIMGYVLAIFCGMEATLMRSQSQPGLPVQMELACWFYLLGKVARLVSDYLSHRPGKPDTWHDITVYSMMARRIQETGQWP
jgi:hypothetical protein